MFGNYVKMMGLTPQSLPEQNQAKPHSKALDLTKCLPPFI